MSLSDHYCSISLFAYILSGLFFAAVRWFHVCHPYDKNIAYYFPDRREMTLIYTGVLMLLPYVICPSNHEAWIFVKAYFIILIPFYCGLLIYRYFGSIKHWNEWKTMSFYLGILFFATIIFFLFVAIFPQVNLPIVIRRHNAAIILTEGMISVLYCLYAVQRTIHWLQLAKEDYSNIDDFPINYARRVLFIPFIHIALIWPAVLYDSQQAMAIIYPMLAVCNIVLLLFDLHPQRTRHIHETVGNLEDTQERQDTTALSRPKTNTIIEDIRRIVEKDRQFLNPNLSLQDVVAQCPYGRTYVSYVFKNHLGGFFNYVNNLRVNYSEAYRLDHPTATLDEIATASGFTSRQTFYRVKKRLDTHQ
ncbi:MAG: hypothetical protein IKX24_08305 [Prevotella sp.]|nr:hypothetical protein [Prevotella sp.]